MTAPQTCTAAILERVGAAFSVEEITVDPPGPGEARVRIRAVGVCHSDAGIRDGAIPHRFPAVVGHEAVAEVTDVGEGVDVTPGARVLVSWIPQCGVCRACRRGNPHLCERAATALRGKQLDGTYRRHRSDGAPLNAMGAVGAFATVAVVPGEAIVQLPADIPDEEAALIGCAVLTGYGAAVNTAAVCPGDRVAVIGVGGVGLNAVQGSRIAGAETIVAIDPNRDRLELAGSLGATHLVNPSDEDAGSAVRSVHRLGLDAVIDTAGQAGTARLAFDLLAPGGAAVVVGIPGPDLEVGIPLFPLISGGRRLLGSWFGDTDLRRDVPRVLDLWRSGDLRLDSLVTDTTTLAGVEDAVTRISRGQGVRTIIRP